MAYHPPFPLLIVDSLPCAVVSEPGKMVTDGAIGRQVMGSMSYERLVQAFQSRGFISLRVSTSRGRPPGLASKLRDRKDLPLEVADVGIT
jgi:hypothetical protein